MGRNNWLALEQFEALVEEALTEIPAALWNTIDNVGVVVEDWPNPRQISGVRIAPGNLLLGLYEGVPLTRRSAHDSLRMPDKITIFRGPILLICPEDENAVRQQVRRTVLHEIAHHFGISDERLHELGAY